MVVELGDWKGTFSQCLVCRVHTVEYFLVTSQRLWPVRWAEVLLSS